MPGSSLYGVSSLHTLAEMGKQCTLYLLTPVNCHIKNCVFMKMLIIYLALDDFNEMLDDFNEMLDFSQTISHHLF